jgi:hypothetical protein
MTASLDLFAAFANTAQGQLPCDNALDTINMFSVEDKALFVSRCVPFVNATHPLVHFERFPRTLTRRASEGIEATFGAALACASG